MAIFNIQEILHPNDSNQIKWEKVNYNFDQLLANGGGPEGTKGSLGQQGSVGLTGQKGNQGEIGPQGLTGATSSRWQVIPINPAGATNNDYVILKPKVSTDNYHPVIFLGDQSFDEGQSNNGLTNLRSTITIGKHAVGGVSPSDEYVTFWHGQRTGTTNDIAITLSSSEVTETTGGVTTDWTRFTLAETYGVNLNTNPAEIVEFYVELDKYTFKSKVGFSSEAANSFKLPSTNLAVNELEGGMIRYFAGSFWGAFEDSNGAVEWKEFCTAPCGAGNVSGTVSIVEDPADLNLNQYGGQIGNTVSIIPSGNLELDENGAVWTGQGVPGCTDPNATNYDPNATVDDGSCIAPIYGCMDPAALNYYPGANIDFNCCYIQGCTNANASNYNPDACIDDGSCNLETIEFTGAANALLNMSASGGVGDIGYITGPTAGMIVSTATKPAWITINSYQNSNFEPELAFSVQANAGASTRTGTIVIAHPDDASVTATVNVSQLAVSSTIATTLATSATAATTVATVATTPATGATAATTQATAATTPVTAATTQATIPPPVYNSLIVTPTSASFGNADEGTTLTYTVAGSYIPNGTKVWLDYTGTHNRSDVAGEGSGGGSGESPQTSSWGNFVIMNNNVGTTSLTIENDNILEAMSLNDRETIIATLWPQDFDGNSTEGHSVTTNITDTSFPATASFSGGFSQSMACDNNNVAWSISYDGTQADFISKMTSVNNNIYINYGRVISASNNTLRTPDAGWGADKVDMVFQIGGPTNQSGTDCSVYATVATTTYGGAPSNTTVTPTTTGGGGNPSNRT